MGIEATAAVDAGHEGEMSEQAQSYQDRVLAIMESVLQQTKPTFDPLTNLRDYFAAHALTGQMAEGSKLFKKISADDWPRVVAETAYLIADAMLKARDA
jgi:hypothetical protein